MEHIFISMRSTYVLFVTDWHAGCFGLLVVIASVQSAAARSETPRSATPLTLAHLGDHGQLDSDLVVDLDPEGRLRECKSSDSNPSAE